VTVAVLGEIDFTNADEVAQGLHDALTRWQPSTLRVDLVDASFIDSTGLGALIEGYRLATEHECAYLVINPTATFRRVLTVTGLCDLFGLPEPGASLAPASATGT
jgi:anti-sigma B factor antagonist